MAHKIDNSKGFDAFVSYAAPAWHNLGTVLNDAISAKDALEKGGLDFKVIKSPNIHRFADKEIISSESFFNYRDDTNVILAHHVGKQYTVFQNESALNIVDEILQSGKATIETAGAIDFGRKVFICLKYCKDINVSNDITKTYCLVFTSHDGSLPIIALPTNVRVVCNNTLQMALGEKQDKISIRHTTNASDRLKEALKVLNLLEKTVDKTEYDFYKMSQSKLSASNFFDYIGNVFLDTDEIKKLQKGEKEVLSTRKKNVIESVLSFAELGQGQKETFLDSQPTLWTGLNAITGYLTRKNYKTPSDRMESLIFGNSSKIINKATELAVQPDSIESLKLNQFNLN